MRLFQASTDRRVIEGDCLAILPTLDAESVDAIVTDPPYGLAFMGKAWDHGVPGETFWREALRVAKPGAHLVAFGGTRTFHRLATAIEDAGWEIRDNLGYSHMEHVFCQCVPYADRSVCDMRNPNPQSAESSEAERIGVLQGVVSEQDVRGPMSAHCVDGSLGLDDGESGERVSEDARTTEPGVARRRNDLQKEGKLRRRQVRARATVGASDGASGRVCDGASDRDGGTLRIPVDTDRSGTSQGPRSDEQRSGQLGDLAVEWIPQGGGVWPGCRRCGKPLSPPLFQGPLAWNYGSGFPKSLDVSKAIDRNLGVPREVAGRGAVVDRTALDYGGATGKAKNGLKSDWVDNSTPNTDTARQWSGWGTALKPAWEPIILARKPLQGTVAQNVQTHGCGSININGCRIRSGENSERGEGRSGETNTGRCPLHGLHGVREDRPEVAIEHSQGQVACDMRPSVSGPTHDRPDESTVSGPVAVGSLGLLHGSPGFTGPGDEEARSSGPEGSSGTPGGNGETLGPLAERARAYPSHQREQGRQPAGESGADGLGLAFEGTQGSAAPDGNSDRGESGAPRCTCGTPIGRWPANLLLDEGQIEVMALRADVSPDTATTISEFYRGYCGVPALWERDHNVSEPHQPHEVLRADVLCGVAVGESDRRLAPDARAETPAGFDRENAADAIGRRETRPAQSELEGELSIERLCNGEPARTPRDTGASSRNGADSRPSPSAVGSGASQERDQDRQPAGESRTSRRGDAQAGASGHREGTPRVTGRERTTTVLACDLPEGWRRYFRRVGFIRTGSAALLDAQTGGLKGGVAVRHRGVSGGVTSIVRAKPEGTPDLGYGDSGGASRFFYTAKAATSERNDYLPDGTRNTHPTVKPVDLMRWMVRLVTPLGGTVLDPFCGSGSTGVAAGFEGMAFVGIELSPEYAAIARKRLTIE